MLIPIPILTQDINPNCVYYQEMTLGERYYIFNKEYPGNYSSGTACQWRALSPINSKVVLACDAVHLPKSLNCFQDRLEISSTENDIHKYCGDGGFMFVTKENTLDFVQRSTTRSPGGSFLCTITSIEDKTEENQNSFQNLDKEPGCQCGWKNDKRIVGGHDTLVNEYPAMAGVVRIDTGGIFCGGTIISRKYVLTAAHCVVNQDVNNYRVLVGDHDTSIGSDTNSSAIYRARKFIVHPKYNSSNYNNDLALIKVDTLMFNDNVGPICLPFRYTANIFTGENVTAVGWGHKEFSGTNSDILQEVDLEIITNQMCKVQANFTISSSQICTYTPDKDACQSDSGGPLFWQNFHNMKKLFLVGVISYGVGCASSSPGVHTRVTSFLNWIIEATNSWLLLTSQWLLLTLVLPTAGQSCQYSEYLVADHKYVIHNYEYPNKYNQFTSCIWILSTMPGSSIYISCNVNLPQSQNCQADKFYVSRTGNSQLSDAQIYCGNGNISLYSKSNVLSVGLYGLSRPGGKFLCTVTAVKGNDSHLPLDQDQYDNCDCGWRQMKRITGGVNTGVNEFPFMVALIYNSNMWCGGSLISDRFVLSAAHCVVNKKATDFALLVGDHDITTGSDTPDSAIYQVSAYEIHPNYDISSQKNDIALLQSSTQIYFGLSVGPVCLPLKYTYQSFAGQPVTLIGWGQTEFGGQISNVLQKTQVNVISNSQCASQQTEPIIDGELCTYYPGEIRDACQFDSGGPVVWFDPASQRFQLVGIISHGVACGISAPAINTRVTEYLIWIIDRTSENYCVK
ncbi:transmembrane protease serine 9-like [Euwallacea similis]|uniref:transmembrane protease serine 9-like n=1 Tax=Euwallacea similis TaxID=1736056 RepID=UPI00344F5717